VSSTSRTSSFGIPNMDETKDVQPKYHLFLDNSYTLRTFAVFLTTRELSHMITTDGDIALYLGCRAGKGFTSSGSACSVWRSIAPPKVLLASDPVTAPSFVRLNETSVNKDHQYHQHYSSPLDHLMPLVLDDYKVRQWTQNDCVERRVGI